MNALAILAAAFLLVGGLVLAGFWAIWHLWCFVIPAIWETGPASIIHPGYWLFVGMWMLISLIGSAIFKTNSKE